MIHKFSLINISIKWIVNMNSMRLKKKYQLWMDVWQTFYPRLKSPHTIHLLMSSCHPFFFILLHYQKKKEEDERNEDKITFFFIEWDEKFLNIKSLHTISSFFSTSHSLLRFPLIFIFLLFWRPIFRFSPLISEASHSFNFIVRRLI